MMFFAERFGEAVHKEMLTTPLADVLRSRGMTVDRAFSELRAWFQRKVTDGTRQLGGPQEEMRHTGEEFVDQVWTAVDE